jgi:hypothetical protein
VALSLTVAIAATAVSIVAFRRIVDAWRPLVARQPPAVQIFVATGFPDAWVNVLASDGSFGVTAPGPGTLSQVGGVWSLDVHGWTSGSCAFYIDWAGPETDPRGYTHDRLNEWVSKMSDPHDPPVPVRAGTAIGWRTRMSYEDGDYPVGWFQVLYAEGWEYSMGCGLGMTHPRSAERLTQRFLNSFRTTRPHDGPTRLDVGTPP